MKRILLLLALVMSIGLVILITKVFLDREPRPSWTTESPRAREAFEHALESLMKSYLDEAITQLDRALELDPSFAMARLFRDLVEHEIPIDTKKANLRAMDLDALSPREMAMVQAMLASLEGHPAEAATVLDAYLQAWPNDPFIRFVSCSMAWDRLDWAQAESCYEELLDRHPNWVEAQNHLGYIAMAEGRFQAAEDRFEAYRFVAPDLANPYDSLAELALLRGDLDKARGYLQRALAIRPDFCAALFHQVQLESFAGRFDLARRLIAETSETSACQGVMMADVVCITDIRIAYVQSDFEGVWQASERCPKERSWNIAAHRAALLTGRDEEARAIEQALASLLEEAGSTMPAQFQQGGEALLLSYEGTRLMILGRYAEAAERFRDSDHGNRYWGVRQGWLFKLFNRVDFLEALKRSGAEEEAAAEEAALLELNPLIVDFFGPGARAVADAGMVVAAEPR